MAGGHRHRLLRGRPVLAALLLATTLTLVGYQVDGTPVEWITLSVDEIKASPAGQMLLASRAAERAEEVAGSGAAPRVLADPGPAATTVPAGVLSPSDSWAPTPPGQIVWRPEVEQWRPLVQGYFGAETEHALAVIRCESLGDPQATNPISGTAGLFQHRPQYWPSRSSAAGWAGADIYDPEANTAVAAWLVQHGGGWSHWSGRAWGVASCEEYACAQGVC